MSNLAAFRTLTPFGTPWIETHPDLIALLLKRGMTFREICHKLEEYYFSNGLYRQTEKGLRDLGVWKDGMRPLRNPVSRAVEFHVARMWPGRLGKELEIVTENDTIHQPIKQLWQWSNWERQKDLAARWGTLFGNLFIKIAEEVGTNSPKVIMQTIHPADVSDVKHDFRGNITYIRIDTPTEIWDEDEAGWVEYFRTEIWDLEADTFQVWDNAPEAGIPSFEDLGAPDDQRSIRADFQVDFIPIVHGKAIDVGHDFGLPIIWGSLDKIDELNQLVTGLHTRLGRHEKVTWAVTSTQAGPGGKAIPSPVFFRQAAKIAGKNNDTLNMGGERFISLPSQSDLKSLVPNLNYKAMLDVVNAQMEEIREDLPELKYSTLHTLGTGNLSGRAIRLLLSDAVDRVHKSRSSFEDTVIRAHKMALTVGQGRGIWDGLGTYEAGDFEHTFNDRDVINRTEHERAEMTKLRVESGVPLEVALAWEGKTTDEVTQVERANDKAQRKALKNMQKAAQASAVELGYEGRPTDEDEDGGESET